MDYLNDIIGKVEKAVDFPVTKVDKEALRYWLVCLLNVILDFLDVFLDFFFGFTIRNGNRKARELAIENDDSAVQVVQIVLRGKL